MTQNVVDLRAALRLSHDRLVHVMGFPASPAPDAPAYPSDWNVGAVLSHLGSGAEIFGLILGGLQSGQDAPTQDDFVAIWDHWNGKTPRDQVDDGLRSDAEFVALIDTLDDGMDQVPAFGSTWPIAEFLAMRLQEHVVHTWDVEVASNRYATLPAEQLPFLLAQLPGIAPRSARGVDEARVVLVRVVEPEARFRVELGPITTITPTTGDDVPGLTMSAESFVRLVFGRLATVRRADVAPDDVAAAAYLKSVFVGY